MNGSINQSKHASVLGFKRTVLLLFLRTDPTFSQNLTLFVEGSHGDQKKPILSCTFFFWTFLSETSRHRVLHIFTKFTTGDLGIY